MPAWSVMTSQILVLLISYLLGSIPFAYPVVRFVSGGDIRDLGSGNVGATNVLRSTSKVAGIATLALDAAKGAAAVLIAREWMGTDATGWMVLAGVAAIVGHVFPVFLKFQGGKGVATGCGAFLVIAPLAILTAALVFVATVAVTRYVSLGSVLASASVPIASGLMGQPPVVMLGALAGAGLVIAKHHTNLRRLYQGRENKFQDSKEAP